MEKTVKQNEYGRIIVKTRHSVLVCKKTDSHDHSCTCAKQLYLYRKGYSTDRITAGTNDLVEAVGKAVKTLESWTPAAQELASRKQRDKLEQITVAEAVTTFLDDFARRHKNPNADSPESREGKNGTWNGYRIALQKFMLEWVDCYNATHRPEEHIIYVRDITTRHLMSWVNSWAWADLTCKNRLVTVRIFFRRLHKSGQIANDPTHTIESPKQFVKGNRTTIFTEEQYQTILHTAVTFKPPENVPLLTKNNWNRRLSTFVELMRWTGMAIVDAVLFQPVCIDEDGTLTYIRHKSGVTATIPLAAIAPHMLKLLRDIPLEDHSVGPNQPFRTRGSMIKSDTHKWNHDRLGELFKRAGIAAVRNNVGRVRNPHSHMFRDTFAGYCLNELDLELPDVSKMLGHANTKITEECYWPWVKQRSDALARRVRDARTAYTRRMRKSGKVISIDQAEDRIAVSAT